MPALPIQEWLAILGEFYDQYGYLIVLLGTLSENTALLGLFLPGNTLALLGAAYARLGSLNLGLVILLATLGTMLGYHVDYLIGRFALAGIVTRLSASRVGRRMRLAGRLRQARMLLRKHGGKAILVSHLIGHLRSFVALSAGLTQMPYWRFLAFELVAATLWSTIFCLLGYFIAGEIEHLQMVLERSGWVIFAVLLLLFLAWHFLKKRVRRRLRQQRQERRRERRERQKQPSVPL